MPQVAPSWLDTAARLTVVGAIVWLATVRSVEACACVQSTCGSAASYDAVFEATIEGIGEPGSPIRAGAIRLSNVRPLRGAMPGTFVSSLTSCAFSFEVGKRYLIFAFRNEDGSLETSVCSLTRALEGSGGMVRYVESLSSQATGARIFGRVAVPEVNLGKREASALGGVRIIVEGRGRRLEATTDETGEFEFTGLAAGVYRVSSVSPKNRPDLETRPFSVNLPHGAACEEVSIVPRPLPSTISGAVRSEQGASLAGVLVELREADLIGTFVGDRWRYLTDKRGSYVFPDVPPGRYVVGVSLETVPDQGKPYPSSRARTRTGATEIEVSAGERIELQPLTLLGLDPIWITGRVVDEQGDPLPGILVRPVMQADDGRWVSDSALPTGADGGFRLRGYEGVRYRVAAGLFAERPEAVVEVVSPPLPLLITLPHR